MSAPVHAANHAAPADRSPAAAPRDAAAVSDIFALLLGDADAIADTTAATRPVVASTAASDTRDDGSEDGQALVWADLALRLTPLPADATPYRDAMDASLGPSSSPLDNLPQPVPLATGPLPAIAMMLPLAPSLPASSANAAINSTGDFEWMFAGADGDAAATTTTPAAALLPTVDASTAAAQNAPAPSLTAVVTQKLFELTDFEQRRGTPAPVALDPIELPVQAAQDKAIDVALPPGAANRVADAFAEGMATRLGWMAEQKIGRAELELHPDDLGSIEIQLEMHGNEVRAEFAAATPEARHLLESALPRLHELFAAQGLELTQADVNAQGQSQSNPAQVPAPPFPERKPGADVRGDPAPMPPRRSQLDGGRISEYV